MQRPVNDRLGRLELQARVQIEILEDLLDRLDRLESCLKQLPWPMNQLSTKLSISGLTSTNYSTNKARYPTVQSTYRIIPRPLLILLNQVLQRKPANKALRAQARMETTDLLFST